MMKHYALYKGDKFITEGTLIKLASELNVKYRTLKFYLTPCYKRRCKRSKNRRILIEL